MSRRAWASISLLCSAAALACAGGAAAQPPASISVRLAQGAALVHAGTVWLDGRSILLQRFGSSTTTTLGELAGPEGRGVQIASSATAVALLAGVGAEESERAFIGGLPPAPLRPLPQPTPVSGGGCTGWEPSVSSLGDFVVAADDLVSAASSTCATGAATRQPLFVRSLRGGGWRVLRWLAGGEPPVLAAEGDLLAVGTQLTSAHMDVVVFDIRNGRVRARLALPDGALVFASPSRLVLARPQGFPVTPVLQVEGASIGGGEGASGPYQLALYTTGGRRLAELGSAGAPPLVSGMHMVANEPTGETQTLFVRDLAGGAPVPVIGFNPPVRALATMAFRWPALAIVQTTSPARARSEVSCENGYYGPKSEPFLGVFDLATPARFVAPPPSSPLEASGLLADCPISK